MSFYVGRHFNFNMKNIFKGLLAKKKKKKTCLCAGWVEITSLGKFSCSTSSLVCT